MKIKKIGPFIIFMVLSVFQVATTNYKSAYSFTPAEIDQQIRRMNLYPPRLAKLGYLWEAKREIQIGKRVIANFLTAIDFKEYFPARVPYLFSPLILAGLYFFVLERKVRRSFYILFLASILTLTVVGPYAKYGPVIIYPFFLLFIVLAIQKIFQFKRG